MYTLILHFNFYINIILVFKFIKVILFFLDLNGETRGKNNGHSNAMMFDFLLDFSLVLLGIGIQVRGIMYL